MGPPWIHSVNGAGVSAEAPCGQGEPGPDGAAVGDGGLDLGEGAGQRVDDAGSGQRDGVLLDGDGVEPNGLSGVGDGVPQRVHGGAVGSDADLAVVALAGEPGDLTGRQVDAPHGTPAEPVAGEVHGLPVGRDDGTLAPVGEVGHELPHGAVGQGDEHDLVVRALLLGGLGGPHGDDAGGVGQPDGAEEAVGGTVAEAAVGGELAVARAVGAHDAKRVSPAVGGGERLLSAL